MPNAFILLLSSERVDREVMSEVLTHAGYVVSAAGDLGAAVDRMAETPYDLLITHPYVESIPGHEAAKYLGGKDPKMAILVVAGLPDDDRIEIRAQLQGFEIFPPPYTAAQLLEKVADVLRKKHAF